jgi:hypothetical protein
MSIIQRDHAVAPFCTEGLPATDGRFSSRRMARCRWRRGRLLLVPLAVVGLSAAVAQAATPAWPTHKCGTFRHWVPPEAGLKGFYYHISVYNGHVGCPTAMSLIKGFWSGKGRHHGGSDDAHSWWTIPGYAGWSCRRGAGAGSCTRHRSIAAYEVH